MNGDIGHRLVEQVEQLSKDRVDRNARIRELEDALRAIVALDDVDDDDLTRYRRKFWQAAGVARKALAGEGE